VSPADPSTTNLWAIGRLVQALDGQAFTDTVARFRSSDPTATAGSFTATIDWGDGTTSAGTITAEGRHGFDVEGTHTYSATAASGVGFPLGDSGFRFFLIAVTIQDTSANASAVSWSVAIVAPTPPIDTAERQITPIAHDMQVLEGRTTIAGVELDSTTATLGNAGNPSTSTRRISVMGTPSFAAPPVLSSKVTLPPVQHSETALSQVSLSSVLLGNGLVTHLGGDSSQTQVASFTPPSGNRWATLPGPLTQLNSVLTGQSQAKTGTTHTAVPPTNTSLAQELKEFEMAFWLDAKG
jgi:hypothetical protein